MKKKKICSGCDQNKYIVNSFFNLCLQCNRERLDSSDNTKSIDIEKMSISVPKCALVDKSERLSLFKKDNGKKNPKSEIQKDNEFYKECFESCLEHYCEECGTRLPDIFEYEGKVVARWRYSHIIPKSIAPWLRRSVKNINHLCFKCHQKWENGDKESMKIYEGNCKRFPNHFK